MTQRALQIVILAAGKGTRMKSSRPKVMHGIAGRSMLAHVIDLAKRAGAAAPIVVIGPGMDDVRAETMAECPEARVFVQETQSGTADAVLAAREVLGNGADGSGAGSDCLVLYGDTPLIRLETLERLRQELSSGADVAVLGFHADDPTGYGRLLTTADGSLDAIREHKDASDEERKITLCNSGVVGLAGEHLLSILDRIGNDNANGEYYLTDAVEIARADGLKAAAVTCPEGEVLGINTRVQLATAEGIYQARKREELMLSGVTMIAPDTVWLAYDTDIAPDVTIEPNVFFAPGVTVAEGAVIRANSHLEGASVGAGAKIGPYARLRPGAKLGAGVHIGNFVEVKNVAMGDGAKANHLAYLGDGTVGSKANVGAGTIFCNYDGFNKAQTNIGDGAFIGSNSSLVAPVEIGEGAYIGSGSVITKAVAAGALALERSKQEERPGWATRFREMMARRKKK